MSVDLHIDTRKEVRDLLRSHNVPAVLAWFVTPLLSHYLERKICRALSSIEIHADGRPSA